MLVRNQLTGFHAGNITRKHSDAVTIMSRKISLDQVISDDSGFIARAASSQQDLNGNRSEVFLTNKHYCSVW